MRREPLDSPVADSTIPVTPDPSRQRRTLAGVMAQYIQDLTREA